MRELARSARFRQFRRRGTAGIGLLGVALWMVLMLAIGFVAIALIQRARRPTSVVVVVLDTVRSDHCSAYGYARPTTPNLAALAAEGLLFEQARAVAPWTLPSHASIFTGLLPSQHGCTWEHRWLIDRFETMAERLAAAGRETFGVTTNANASSLYHLEQGFGTFVETWTRRDAHRGRSDSSIANAEIAAWLARRDMRKPFFLFVNYSDAHLPYAPSPPYDQQFGAVSERARALASNANLLHDTLVGDERVAEEDRAGLAALYDGEVRTADGHLGELLALLKQHGAVDDTLVIVTADHGEMLGEHGEVDHQLSLSEPLLRVPLVVRYPGRVNPARIPEPVPLTVLKEWIEAVAEERAPDWSPAPDQVEPALIAQHGRPVDLIDAMAKAGRDAVALDRRLFAAWRIAPDGGGHKLVRALPGGDTFWRVDPDGREERVAAGDAEIAEALARALDDALAIDPFEELAEDFEVERAVDADALAQARASGYAAAIAAGSVGIHASEHWCAARRAVALAEWELAFLEFKSAAQLAPAEATILLELAQATDAAGHPDTAGAIDRFLGAVGSGSPAPATGVEWATRRRDELRAERRGRDGH